MSPQAVGRQPGRLARRPHNVKLSVVMTYAALTLASVAMLLPIAWAVVTSLKPEGLAVRYPPQLVPDPATLANYGDVLGGSLPRYMFNSGLLAGGTILATLTVAALGAYAAARLRFAGKDALLLLIMATVMIPGVSVVVPLFLMVSKVGLTNTYQALILVYTAWHVPLVLWLLRGFFETIPSELDDAAAIDGCNRWQAFWLIALPLIRPGLAAAAVIVFIGVWNEFLFGLALTSSSDMRPVQTGVYLELNTYGIPWARLMAGVIVSLLPVVVMFLFTQRHLIRGLTAGATKG